MVIYTQVYLNKPKHSEYKLFSDKLKGKMPVYQAIFISVKWTERGCYLAWNHVEWPWKILKSNQEHSTCAHRFLIVCEFTFPNKKTNSEFIVYFYGPYSSAEEICDDRGTQNGEDCEDSGSSLDLPPAPTSCCLFYLSAHRLAAPVGWQWPCSIILCSVFYWV